MIPDHLPATGIVCQTEDELVSFCHRVIQKGTAIQVPDAERRLVRYEIAKDVHVWMYVNPGNEVESLFPFYYPVASHDLEVARFIEEDGDRSNLLVGGWLLEEASERLSEVDTPSTNEEHSHPAFERQYRLSYVCVDAPLYPRAFESGAMVSCQLLGVCRKPKLHLDERAFEQVQHEWGGTKNIQSKTVIPSDVLNLDVDPYFEGAALKPYAYITGIVQDTNVHSESRLDASFMHIVLDTNGMNLDVLLAEQAVPTTPEQGNVLEGHFLLLGMKKPRGRSAV